MTHLPSSPRWSEAAAVARRTSSPGYPTEAEKRYRHAGVWQDRTIPDALAETARRHPERPALLTAETRWTYAELTARVDGVAAGVLAAGLEPGDRVILQIANSPHAVVAWYGLLRAGVIPVCTLPVHRRHEITAIARQAGARGHLVDADQRSFDLVAFAAETRAEVPSLAVLLTIGAPDDAAAPRVEDLAATTPTPAQRRRLRAIGDATDLGAPAVFQLSGGTTGTPKIIPRRHPEYWYNAVATARWWGLTPDDRLGFGLPLVHNAGITNALHAAHASGAALVLGTPRADHLLPLMAAEHATWFMSPPGVMRDYLDHRDFAAAFAHVRTCVLTASRVARPLFDELESRGVHVTQAFGMTEGLFLFTPPDASRALRAGTVGAPVSPLDEVRLLRPGTTEPVADGELGELCARGPYTVPGYHDAPEHDAVSFTPDGFYRSGDLVRAHRMDGMTVYSVEGRVKDVINRGGEKVNAEEVEALLTLHQAVVEAALVAMPDERLGERACAYLVVAGRQPRPDLADLRAFLERRGVARYKWPERVEYLDALPRTSIGKVFKTVLRDDIERRIRAENGG